MPIGQGLQQRLAIKRVAPRRDQAGQDQQADGARGQMKPEGQERADQRHPYARADDRPKQPSIGAEIDEIVHEGAGEPGGPNSYADRRSADEPHERDRVEQASAGEVHGRIGPDGWRRRKFHDQPVKARPDDQLPHEDQAQP